MRHLTIAALALALILGLGLADAQAQRVTVGSKEFTEQLILGEITVLALESAGFDVIDRTGLAGTQAARAALENGEIDVYWEYTGTAWLVALQHDQALTDPEEAYRLVKEEDAANGLVWLNMSPFDNTYTLMMRRAQAEELGIVTISDLAAYVQANPDQIDFATNHEFYARPDGFPGLENLYEFRFPRARVHVMDSGLTYAALRDDQVDVAMGFATDGRIAAFDLVNLVDDRRFFPVYNPAPVVRADAIERVPGIEPVLNDLGPRISTEEMIRMNYEVDIEGKRVRQVAEEWLRSEGILD